MAKKVKVKIKLQCPGGQANPAPPEGPALGPHGIPITMAINMAAAVNCNVAGIRSITIGKAGSPYRRDIPKSPLSMIPLRKSKN